MFKTIAIMSFALGTLFASSAQAASPAAGLPSSSYTASQGEPASAAFNGGSWNALGYGDAWIQADLLSPYLISGVQFQTNQLPDGITSHKIFISDTPIGDSWPSLSPVAEHSGYTSTGDTLSFNFSQVSGRYLEILLNNGSSWTALKNVTITAAVPEPETYGMLLLGLGLLGAVTRRKRQA